MVKSLRRSITMAALKSKIKIAFSFCLIISSLTGVRAQSGRLRGPAKPQPPQNQHDRDTVRLRAEEVLLPVSIHSNDGKLPQLNRTDVIVAEDGKRQQVTAV